MRVDRSRAPSPRRADRQSEPASRAERSAWLPVDVSMDGLAGSAGERATRARAGLPQPAILLVLHDQLLGPPVADPLANQPVSDLPVAAAQSTPGVEQLEPFAQAPGAASWGNKPQLVSASRREDLGFGGLRKGRTGQRHCSRLAYRSTSAAFLGYRRF